MSFDNDIARNVVIFGIKNTSSSHTDNRKNNFSVLPERLVDDINDSVGTSEKKVSINFAIANAKISLSLH